MLEQKKKAISRLTMCALIKIRVTVQEYVLVCGVRKKGPQSADFLGSEGRLNEFEVGHVGVAS